ncbi:MAG: transporter substrate-binding domain-containing protein [Clostridiales bacterium]|jgi:ABC-type amino acid transport substrate-binding protein|nr:transporter substrate-binding domain-containing protein [Clostridiales bacterium]
MKRILAIILVVACMAGSILLFSSCGKINAGKDLETIKKAGTLKVGMECNYAPFNWTQAKTSDTAVALSAGGYADGYDVQIALEIAKALGVELEIVKLEWGGLIPALESGKIDCIIAGMSPTAERKMSIDFTDHYYTSELVMVIRADGEYVNAKSISDFSGAKITGQSETFHYSVIDQIDGVQKQTAMSDFTTMLTALQGKKIDGYVSELPGAKSAVTANPDLTYIVFDEGKGFEASEDDVAVSIGIRKGSNLASDVNAALKAITQDDRDALMQWALENQPLTAEE